MTTNVPIEPATVVESPTEKESPGLVQLSNTTKRSRLHLLGRSNHNNGSPPPKTLIWVDYIGRSSLGGQILE